METISTVSVMALIVLFFIAAGRAAKRKVVPTECFLEEDSNGKYIVIMEGSNVPAQNIFDEIESAFPGVPFKNITFKTSSGKSGGVMITKSE